MTVYYLLQFSLILCVAGSNISEWDIAVSSEKQIELLTHKGDLVASIRHSLSHASALAFDSIHSVLYVSDTSERNVSIFRIHVTKDGKSGLLQPVVQSNVKFIEGLAYDAVSSTIFWSTGSEKTIMSARLDENKTELAVGSVLHKFSDELVYGIAVDSCTGKLYWTNCNVAKPSIERSDLNGNNREVVVSTRLFRPMAVTISQADRLMYWVEEKTGYLFSVERCALDGSNRQTIVLSENQQPLALAVSGSRLYWTDDMHTSVWSVMHSNPDLQMPMVETRLVKTYSERSTILGGVISAYQDSPLDENVCRNMIDLRTKVSSVVNVPGGTCLHGLATQTGGCLCAAGYSGIHCETSLCHNFCLNRGECFLDNAGAPVCKCSRPFAGPRCELDLCKNKCLNGGYCSVLPSGTSSECHCTNSYLGERCQLPTLVCEQYCYKVATTQNFDRSMARQCRCTIYAIESSLNEAENRTDGKLSASSSRLVDKKWLDWSLGVSCLMLLSICIVLSVLVYKLKGRPRLIRRYQVNPSSFNKSAAAASPPDCEIAIENCCNMNICDTPCYEPEFRTPGKKGNSKKEEKCGLLPNMEVQPADSSQDLF